MTVSSILDAVREGWNFVWPPCFLLLVLLVLARILAPLSLRDFGSYLGRLLQLQKRLIAILRLYGLGKFVGIIEAFGILFLLYVVHQVVPAVGDAIPGQLTYTPSVMWVRTVDHESLACALASLPGASIDTLEGEVSIRKKAIQAKLGGARAEDFFSSDWWQRKNGDTVLAFNICKALMLYAVVVAVIEVVRKRKVLRSVGVLFLVLLGLILLAAYLLGEQVYEHEQEDFALLSDARVMADVDGFSCENIPTAQADQIRRTLWRAERDSEVEPGWRLEVVDYYFTWLRRKLSPQQVPQEQSQVYLAGYSPGILSDTPRLKQLIADTDRVWRTQIPKESQQDIARTIQHLLNLGYVLPLMITDDKQLTGSLLRSSSTDATFRFFASATDVLAPLRFSLPDPTSEQKSLCPSRYFAEVEKLEASDLQTVGHINPFTDLRDLLVVTEKLTCLPQTLGPNQPLVLGYRLARIE